MTITSNKLREVLDLLPDASNKFVPDIIYVPILTIATIKNSSCYPDPNEHYELIFKKTLTSNGWEWEINL